MAESQILTILAAILPILDAVTGVQRVYNYEPLAVKPENIVTIMGGSQAIDYWSVTPETTDPQRFQGYQMEFNHVMVFRHYYEVGDAAISTPAVRTIALAVLNRFSTVFSIAPQAEMTGPLQIIWPIYWTLADTFTVHKTEYRLPLKELIVVQ